MKKIFSGETSIKISRGIHIFKGKMSTRSLKLSELIETIKLYNIRIPDDFMSVIQSETFETHIRYKEYAQLLWTIYTLNSWRDKNRVETPHQKVD